jgi:hypothetical protein
MHEIAPLDFQVAQLFFSLAKCILSFSRDPLKMWVKASCCKICKKRKAYLLFMNISYLSTTPGYEQKNLLHPAAFK